MMAFTLKRFSVQGTFLQAVIIAIILSTIHFKVNATNQHLETSLNNEGEEDHIRNHEMSISSNNDRALPQSDYKTVNSLENDRISSHIPQFSRINKRSWQNLQGSWGKRDSYGKNKIDDEIIGVDGLSGNFHGYNDPEHDEYEDLLMTFNKPHQPLAYYNNRDIIDLIRNFPERNSNEDNLISNSQKRAWKNLNAGWGKRLVSRNQGQKNWNGGWGKREPGWNNLKGLWGKRSGWNKLNAGWGKRDQSSISDDQIQTDASNPQNNYY